MRTPSAVLLLCLLVEGLLLSACTCRTPRGKYVLDVSRLRAAVYDLALRDESTRASEDTRRADPDTFDSFARRYAEAFAEIQRGSHITLGPNGQAVFLIYDWNVWRTGNQPARWEQETTVRWRLGRCNTVILSGRNEGVEIVEAVLHRCGRVLRLEAPGGDGVSGINWYFVRGPRK